MNSDSKIEEAYAAGTRAWADVSLTLEAFRAAALEAGGIEATSWASDFFLACAAGRGDLQAIRHIDDRFLSKLAQRIRRLGTPADAVADVLQVVRERLFSGSSPRIRAYNATAPLAQWIKVVAIRTAIDLHRRDLVAAPSPGVLAAALPDVGPIDAQTEIMRELYRREFERVIRELLNGLSQRDQTVLRLHLVEGVGIDRIAVMYGVHRISVARWVWSAGEVVLAGLRRHFREKFGVELREFDSLARLVRSQLSLDLAKVFPAAR